MSLIHTLLNMKCVVCVKVRNYKSSSIFFITFFHWHYNRFCWRIIYLGSKLIRWSNILVPTNPFSLFDDVEGSNSIPHIPHKDIDPLIFFMYHNWTKFWACDAMSLFISLIRNNDDENINAYILIWPSLSFFFFARHIPLNLYSFCTRDN